MSKELEALEKLRQNYKDNTHLFDNDLLDIIEKSLKALEIIKEKKVDCLVVILSQSYIEYNNMCECEEDKLTQKEYDLLKEILL